MAEINNLIMDKLDTILEALKDMRLGLALIVEENLVGISKYGEEEEDE